MDVNDNIDLAHGHVTLENQRMYPRSTLVNETYTDYSTYQLCDLAKKCKTKQSFPMKLYVIVSKAEYQHIISWMPHGRNWNILDRDLLASIICPETFNNNSLTSFSRSVNGWGFRVSGKILFVDTTNHQ